MHLIDLSVSGRPCDWENATETDLERNNLLATFPKITKVFEVSYELMIESFKEGWQSVFHMTTGDDYSEYGSRIASLWVSGNSYLQFSSAVSGNEEHNYDHVDMSVNKWIKIRVGQSVVDRKHVYMIVVDGKKVYSTTNTRPSDFENVKLYAADPWYKPLKGKIRNICIKLSTW